MNQIRSAIQEACKEKQSATVKRNFKSPCPRDGCRAFRMSGKVYVLSIPSRGKACAKTGNKPGDKRETVDPA